MKGNKNRITAYNHKTLDTEDKPLISNADYAFLYQQVKDGNYDAYYAADKKYSFEDKQRKMIEDIIHNRIIK